jgi:hypothetical protein
VVTCCRRSGWICNGNRNLQHAVADRQSNFQVRSFSHLEISPVERQITTRLLLITAEVFTEDRQETAGSED